MEQGTDFSREGRNRLFDEGREESFELILAGGGMSQALTALYAAAAGLKVLYATKGDFRQEIYPLVTEGSTGSVEKEVRKLLPAFRDNAAHVMFPDEFLYLSETGGIQRQLQSLFDRSRERIATSDVNLYEPFLNNDMFETVQLHREYKLDPVRLLMSVLKKASHLGATILNHVSMEELGSNEVLLTDELYPRNCRLKGKQVVQLDAQTAAEQQKEWHFHLSNQKFHLKRSLKLEMEELSVRLVRQQDYFHVILRLEKGKEEGHSQVMLNLLNKVLKEVPDLTKEDILRSFEVNYHPEKELGTCLSEVRRVMMEKCGISSSRFRELLEQTRLAGADFNGETAIHELIQYGDQRYDEAKQTGIAAVDFKPIFYRYGTDVEWLTEEAYQLCRQITNAQLLWHFVEAKYLMGHEMVNGPKDFQQRASGQIISDEEIRELEEMGYPLFQS